MIDKIKSHPMEFDLLYQNLSNRQFLIFFSFETPPLLCSKLRVNWGKIEK